MADPTPMDVDDEAPTDLVLPDVMEGMLRMAALTTPGTPTSAACTVLTQWPHIIPSTSSVSSQPGQLTFSIIGTP